MAVIHKGVDKIIDSSNNEVVISTASTTINAVNDATTGLASKASTTDLNNGLGTKLDATATAVDSAKLGNMAPSHYGLASDVTAAAAAAAAAQATANGKLDATAQAVDSAKLGGQSPSYYAAATGLAATTDGETSLGWDGTKFKVAPAGSNSKVTFAVVGSDNVWTFDATA